MNQPNAIGPVIALLSCLRGGYVALKWQKVDASDEHIKALYEQTLAFMKLHHTPRLLSDHRLRPPLSLAIQKWLQTTWVPQAIAEVGYSHCAIVENNDPIGRLAARAIGMALPAALTSQYFDTMEQAEAWLLQFAKSPKQ